MAPVIRELRGRHSAFDHTIVATAQHRQMLDQVLEVFGIEPDIDLGLMQQDQDLAEFASRSLLALSNLFSEITPDAILVQGDTTTVATAALAAFYKGVRVGHVEVLMQDVYSRTIARSAAVRRRASVEREFGRLKHEWSLLPLRVRGVDRVRLHADLTILAKLACRLATERRTVALAA